MAVQECVALVKALLRPRLIVVKSVELAQHMRLGQKSKKQLKREENKALKRGGMSRSQAAAAAKAHAATKLAAARPAGPACTEVPDSS